MRASISLILCLATSISRTCRFMLVSSVTNSRLAFSMNIKLRCFSDATLCTTLQYSSCKLSVHFLAILDCSSSFLKLTYSVWKSFWTVSMRRWVPLWMEPTCSSHSMIRFFKSSILLPYYENSLKRNSSSFVCRLTSSCEPLIVRKLVRVSYILS